MTGNSFTIIVVPSHTLMGRHSCYLSRVVIHIHFHARVIFIFRLEVISLEFILNRLLPRQTENSPSLRKQYGTLASVTGIFMNLLLFAAKLAIGLLSGAVSIIADAINNLSDMGSSVVMLMGFRIAAKPADPEHPFGHGRAEYLSGLFVAAAILLVGFELLTSSGQKVIHPEELDVNNITLIVLLLSIAGKMLLASFYHTIGNRIDSTTVHAAATDSLMDCVATGIVFITMIVYLHFGINIDGIAGVLVACFILYNGWGTLKDTLQPLLGDAPDSDLITDIKKLVMSSPEILSVHDLIIHNYGPGRGYASMHVEMPATMDLLSAHACIDRLERRLQSKLHLSVTLHIDPVVTDCPEYNQLFVLASRLLASIDESLSLHDFRVVPYKKGRKLVFDVVVPQDFRLNDRQIRKEFLRLLISIHPNDRASIRMDHQYC